MTTQTDEEIVIIEYIVRRLAQIEDTQEFREYAMLKRMLSEFKRRSEA